MKRTLRKPFNKKHLIHTVCRCFQQIADPKSSRGCTLVDSLMSGFAHLKCSSLLEFDQKIRNGAPAVLANRKRLFGGNRVPSDSGMRKRLDEVDPFDLRGVFKPIFAQLQRGKVLERFRSINDHVLLSIDGTGMFFSTSVHCSHCCETHHRNGTITYVHHMLCAAFAPKNRDSSDARADRQKRWSHQKRFGAQCMQAVLGWREYPHLKTIVAQDALFSNAPHLRLLGEHNLR